MDILKARERARQKGEEEQPEIGKVAEGDKPEKAAKEASHPKRAKKSPPEKSAPKKEKKPAGRKKEALSSKPELMPSPRKMEIPEGVKAPEEIELTEEDINGLYGTQEMPELPEQDTMPEEAETLLLEQPWKEKTPEEEPAIKAAKQEKREPKEKPEPVQITDFPEAPLAGEVEADELDVEKQTGSLLSEFFGEEKGAGFAPMEFLSFMLGREEYALPLVRINEIIKPRVITEVPRCATFVLGILSLRGVIIPVLDLAARLGLGKVQPKKHARIVIVCRSDGEMVGLAVDSVQDVVKVLPGDIEPPPPAMAGAEAQFLEGVGRAEDSRRIRAGPSEEKKSADLEDKRKSARRKLVILLNLDKVAVL